MREVKILRRINYTVDTYFKEGQVYLENFLNERNITYYITTERKTTKGDMFVMNDSVKYEVYKCIMSDEEVLELDTNLLYRNRRAVLVDDIFYTHRSVSETKLCYTEDILLKTSPDTIFKWLVKLALRVDVEKHIQLVLSNFVSHSQNIESVIYSKFISNTITEEDISDFVECISTYVKVYKRRNK